MEKELTLEDMLNDLESNYGTESTELDWFEGLDQVFPPSSLPPLYGSSLLDLRKGNNRG